MDGSWIEAYGYWAVFLGGVLEGETVFVAAGFGVSREYLNPVPTFLAAAAGGTAGDLAYYLLGRTFGGRLILAFPLLRPLRARAVLLLRRWGRATAFLMRFAYGLRIILPVTIGAARFPFLVFLVFNLLGSLVFAALYLSLGYLFGETLEEFLGQVGRFDRWILLGLVAVGALFWAAREWGLLHREPDGAEKAEAPESDASPSEPGPV